MKLAIIFAALLAVAIAAPPYDGAEVIHYNSDVNAEGFKYDVALTDGSSRHAEGELKDVGTPFKALAITGSYSYVSDDGKTYTVNYIADENGYRAVGDHLPVSVTA